MKLSNSFPVQLLIMFTLAIVLPACSDSDNSSRAPDLKVDSLTVTSYNVGLALNFVPFTNERLVVNTELLSSYESDVICFQEVWLDDQVEAITAALPSTYTDIYHVPPEQIFSDSAACTEEEIVPFTQCANTQCPDLSGEGLVSCVTAQCASLLPGLSPVCAGAVVGSVGIPDVTVEAVIEAVTQPAGLFAFGGSLGLILASKYPLEARQFQDLIDDSTSNHRGALYAEINLNQQTHVVGCTHPTANLSSTIEYPQSGKHGSWEGENRFMMEQMIAFADNKAGDNPILYAGDFNCSIANASTDVDDDFADNCRLWLDAGYLDPAADQLRCTFCYEDNLLLQAPGASGGFMLDHVFVKNLESITQLDARRIFDDPVTIEALVPPSELQPEDSPMLTHPSDHFGVELDVVY